MIEEDKRAPEEVEALADCFLASRDADGSIRSVGPFSRQRAEALIQAYGRVYPAQTCWVEALPQQVRSLHMGRVQRPRRLPTLAPSDRDH